MVALGLDEVSVNRSANTTKQHLKGARNRLSAPATVMEEAPGSILDISTRIVHCRRMDFVLEWNVDMSLDAKTAACEC